MRNILLIIPILFLIFSCKKEYSLNITIRPENGGTVSPPGGTFEEGSTVEILGTPNEGYKFIEFKGDFFDNVNPTTLTINSDKNIIVVFEDIDEDNDGIFDNRDWCPNTTKGEEVDEFGCSEEQNDIDGDGIVNMEDWCPDTPQGETIDKNGCSDSQKDTDSDGITDNIDLCSDTPSGEMVDENGCSDSQKDTDGDGVLGKDDLCPETPKGEEVDENGCSTSQKTYVPDDYFEYRLIDLGYDDVLDDYVITEKIKYINSLDVTGQQINDFTGIEDFTELETLSCYYNNTDSLNLSNFPNLKNLYCYMMGLKYLEVTDCPKLEELICYWNEIESENIKIKNCPSIWWLDISQNKLTNIDLSNSPSLRWLDCRDNQFSSLNISTCPKLESLNCSKNSFDNLNVSNNTLLSVLNTKNNPQLTCIKVNQTQFENIPEMWEKDNHTSWSLDCGN